MIRRETRQRTRRQARAHRRQDERAAGGRRDPRALRGVAGRREDRSDRARRLRAAPGRARGCRRISACARSSAVFSSTIASGISRTTARRRCGSRRADWMGRNCSAASRLRFPCSTRSCKRAGDRRRLAPYLADTRDAWELRSDGEWTRVAPRGRTAARSAQQELLARMREPGRGGLDGPRSSGAMRRPSPASLTSVAA